MSYSNQTANYKLPLPTGSDRSTWTDTNAGFQAIDTAIKTAEDNAQTAIANAGTALATANTANTNASEALETANSVESIATQAQTDASSALQSVAAANSAITNLNNEIEGELVYQFITDSVTDYPTFFKRMANALRAVYSEGDDYTLLHRESGTIPEFYTLYRYRETLTLGGRKSVELSTIRFNRASTGEIDHCELIAIILDIEDEDAVGTSWDYLYLRPNATNPVSVSTITSVGGAGQVFQLYRHKGIAK